MDAQPAMAEAAAAAVIITYKNRCRHRHLRKVSLIQDTFYINHELAKTNQIHTKM